MVDERRAPTAEALGTSSYNYMKLISERFFADVAASNEQWISIAANPADVIGPILALHQASDTWQGKIGGMLRGEPAPQQSDAGVGPGLW